MDKPCAIGIALALWVSLVADAGGQPIDIAAAKKRAR